MLKAARLAVGGVHALMTVYVNQDMYKSNMHNFVFLWAVNLCLHAFIDTFYVMACANSSSSVH